ncbi:hypothetical protein JW851_00340 [Candidatus Woesearchaeota archaeon]|nr:hypothetical protein [Candidatus Woesearchaeota archaeon]
MSICSSLKNIATKAVIGGIIIGSFLFGEKANAEDAKPQKEPTPIMKTNPSEQFKKPERKTILNLAKSPLDDFSANSKIWYSINQGFGKISDELAGELNLDDHILGRIGQVAVFGYLNYATEYYSHELAHNYETRKKSLFSGVGIDFSDWSMGVPKYNSPAYIVRLYDLFDIFTTEKEEKEYLRTITNGLNQDELDAALVHRESVLKKNLSFDEAISYLIPKNLDLFYIILSTKGGLNYRANYKPINKLQSNFEPSIENQGLWNDIDMYLHHLHRKGLYRQKADDPYNYLAFGWKEGMTFKGIELSKKELFIQALIADALSVKTYDSTRALYKYIAKGERNTKPFTFKLGRTEITPPQITHLLTKEGSFYDTNAFFNIAGKILLETNLGTDVDFIGHGKARHLRTGGKLHMTEKGINIRPFLYINSSRGRIFKYKGISSGLELALGMPDSLEIIVGAGFNENDLIENDVKGKENGIDFTVGVNIIY